MTAIFNYDYKHILNCNTMVTLLQICIVIKKKNTQDGSLQLQDLGQHTTSHIFHSIGYLYTQS